ncbi:MULTISPECIES: SAM-dependent methyltransferase [Actinomadura]|uniref:SAM-dependent methyltransferase n=1 Tax=Actinomadura yumaensis TaxID=111807 RepID=A0ABW2CNX7_9ACTN|nr:SAM-dependent methyltransferase [Actinomadura sp. J1-007]
MTVGTVLSIRRRATLGRPPEGCAPGLEDTPPNIARMHDYFLGGKDNYAADRNLAEQVLREAPAVAGMVAANRAFLRRSVRLLAERAGIRQFVDVGCGLPAGESVDALARRHAPDCRVAYVDNDPLVLSHARALLAVDGGTGAFGADLRAPGGVLAHPELGRLIDLGRPVAVLLMCVLHHVTDAEDPRGILETLVRSLPPGSRVVLSHAERTPQLDTMAALYGEAGVPFVPRTREAIGALVRGLGAVRPRQANLAHSVRDPATGDPTPLVGWVGRTPG